jgi:hypothetical protein
MAGGDSAGSCFDSGRQLISRVFSWGPNDGSAGFKAGIRSSFVGCPNLESIPSTTTRLGTPAPEAFFNDGLEHYLDLHGVTDGAQSTPPEVSYPILHTIYGPYRLTDDSSLTAADGSAWFNHVILDQMGNVRDQLDAELSARLGTGVQLGTTHRWIYGAWLGLDTTAYNGSVITITDPSDGSCKAYYTCEFRKGFICNDGVGPMIRGEGAASPCPTCGLFLIVCASTQVAPVTISCTEGTSALDGVTRRSFPPITVPIYPGADDVVYPEWHPN